MKTEQLQIRLTPRQKAELKRRARRAGQGVSAYVLARALPSSAGRFADILTALAHPDDRRFALAELNDLLVELRSDEFNEALADAPLESLGAEVQNLVAAMVEQAANQKGVSPPGWVAGIDPLERPYFATPLRSLRLHLLRASPVAFRRRNLFVDSAVGDRA